MDNCLGSRCMRVAKLKMIIKTQRKYIKLLGKELNETVPIASSHGWRSSKSAIQEGIFLRALLEEYKDEDGEVDE